MTSAEFLSFKDVFVLDLEMTNATMDLEQNWKVDSLKFVNLVKSKIVEKYRYGHRELYFCHCTVYHNV